MEWAELPHAEPLDRITSSIGKLATTILETTPEGMLDGGFQCGVSACTLAEPRFLKALGSEKPVQPPVIIEESGEVVAVLKLKQEQHDNEEPTILALNTLPESNLYAGGIYAIQRELTHEMGKKLNGKLSVIALDQLVELAGSPLPIRPTTFVLDDEILSGINAQRQKMNQKPLPDVRAVLSRARQQMREGGHQAVVDGEELLRYMHKWPGLAGWQLGTYDERQSIKWKREASARIATQQQTPLACAPLHRPHP